MTIALSAGMPTASTTLVVVPPEALAELVTQAVAAALDGVNLGHTPPLLDRAGLARALSVSTSTVDRLLRAGLPYLRVADAKRFELASTLAYLRSTTGTGRV